MKNLILIMTFISSFLFIGCAEQKSSSIVGQRELPQPDKPEIKKYDPIEPDKIEWITQDGGQSQLDFNPQVDILFIIDNSESMKNAEANLVRNINKFVAGFKANKMIDYHIGVTSVWDSSDRFLQKKKNSYGNGELWNVKNKNGETISAKYLSKSDDIEASLSATLNIGIAPYSEGGPENEEIFSPISETIKKTGRGAVNEGFIRPEAQLVVVILTDAEDASKDITAEQTAQELFDLKKDPKKVSAYAALVRSSDPDELKDWGLRIHPTYHPECFDQKSVRNTLCSQGFAPEKVEQFILAANSEHGTPEQIRAGHIMSIAQKDFGSDLAKIGADITARTLAKQILLEERPRIDSQKELMVRVRYGSPEEIASGKGQVIPQDAKSGWIYNPDDNAVELSGNIQYQYKESARFAVDLVPVVYKTP